MRMAIIRRLSSALVLLLLAVLPGTAQTCTVTPPATFNFGSIDVLANAVVDTQASIGISCTVTAGQQVRLCLSLGDPNGEAGASRYMLNGVNKLYYDFYTASHRTQRWSSWRTGTGSGLEHVFTSATTSYSTTVPLYARVAAGQQMVPTANPALTYAENFSKTATNMFLRARYTSTGQTCPVMTTASATWANAMNVTASVLFKCLVTGGTLDFGTVSSLASAVTAQTNISVTCSNSLAYNVGLDNGLNGTSPTTRKMTSGANSVSYSLFRDASRLLNWGATIGTDTLGGTGTGSAVSTPIYGRVPVQTTPPPATYTDTVQITVTY